MGPVICSSPACPAVRISLPSSGSMSRVLICTGGGGVHDTSSRPYRGNQRARCKASAALVALLMSETPSLEPKLLQISMPKRS